jgi:hypothetical protein
MEDLLYTGKWWRFGAYEIRDGYIRSAPGARLEEYFPLDDFQAARAAREEQRSPYESLMRVSERLSVDAAGQLSPESTAELLDWCARNGLLGLLLHQVQRAEFAPRWERRVPPKLTPIQREEVCQMVERLSESEDPDLQQAMAWLHPSAKEKLEEKEALYVTQAFYQRTNCGSVVFGRRQNLMRSVPMDRCKLGHVVSERLWPRTTPTVLQQKLLSGDWEYLPVAESWGQFFPDVPEKTRAVHQYPKPYSGAFWEAYAEPLEEFIAGVRAFRRAFLEAAAVKNGKDMSEGARVGAPRLSALNALKPPVGSGLLRLRDGSIEQKEISPSLLGSLVIMAQQDLASDRRVIRCANARCGLTVVVIGYQTEYCSQQCRYAAQKRAQRAKLRGADVIKAGKAGRKQSPARGAKGEKR